MHGHYIASVDEFELLPGPGHVQTLVVVNVNVNKMKKCRKIKDIDVMISTGTISMLPCLTFLVVVAGRVHDVAAACAG